MADANTSSTPALSVKKYLDKEGLIHFAKILGNYPDNAILSIIIDAISNTIDETSDSNRQYTDEEIIEALSNIGKLYLGSGDMPDGYHLQINPDVESNDVGWLFNEIKQYIDTVKKTRYDLTIYVNPPNGEFIHNDVYVTIADGNGVVYKKIKYENATIHTDIPVDFEYVITITEIDGFSVETYTGISTENMKLVFSYTKPAIYGVSWDKTSTTVLSRTNDAALFEDPVPYVAGATSYGSPFDNLYPWSGMKIVNIENAGTLVSIPKYWFRWTDTDGMLRLEIANYAAEGFSISPAHRDRGDGKDERDVVYIGRYHCSIDNFKSETGVKPKASMTRADFRTNIHNLGDTIYQNDFAMFWTIRMLYLVEYADWDCQSVIGYGCGDGSSTGVTNMGYTDSMPYHTGTMLSSRTTYGFGTQYRYIEGLWDNVLDWCDGIYFSSANVYGIINPNNFSDTTGGTLVGTRPTSGGYIKSWSISTVDGFDWFLYPATVSDSTTTYISDSCGYISFGIILSVGGSYGQGLVYGMFFLNGNNNTSGKYGGVGSRLMVLP